MGILVTPVQGDFVARLTGLDLFRPLDEGDFGQVRDAFHRYAVVIFPEQALTDDEQIAFSERFGPLEVSLRKDRQRRIDNPRISDISNVDEKDRVFDPDDERAIYNAGNRLWHSDSSFKRVPAMASLLSGREVPPEGGETEYADLRGAWDALPADRQRGLEPLVAEHSFVYSRGLIGYDQFTDAERAAVPPVPQAVVRTHPATGRKSLYLGSHASHILGRPVEEGRADPLERSCSPAAFGQIPNRLLVGNFGDGRIHAYNLETGALRGTLEDEQGEPVQIDGLWGLAVGNGHQGGDPEKLYFTAGSSHEAHGLFGAIERVH
jgi:alpha-ketoglutarate-dependent 2,4-dichlorophenoxyacetate dioxygenase